MATVSDIYPSPWLRADDLAGRTGTVQIESAEVQEFRQRDGSTGRRIVVGFVDKSKQLVCNKTQALAIAEILQMDEFAKWPGHSITLSPGRLANNKPTIIIQAQPGGRHG